MHFFQLGGSTAQTPSSELNPTESRQVIPALLLVDSGLGQEILGLWVRGVEGGQWGGDA